MAARTVVVTGSTKGLGLGLVKSFLDLTGLFTILEVWFVAAFFAVRRKVAS